MPLHRCDSVVIRTEDYGESDKIVTLFSLEFGKIVAIAKGAKRSKRRFVNKLEPFTHVQAFCHFKKNFMPRLEQAELVTTFPSLREVCDRYYASSLVLELMLFWTRENDPNTELFHALLWALDGINRGKPALPVLAGFLVKLLEAVGYRPRLCHCSICGKAPQLTGACFFSVARGGILCNPCRGIKAHSRENNSRQPFLLLSAGTRKLLQKIQELPLDKLGRLHFTPPSLEEALRILRSYNDALLQRDLQCWRFLEIASRPQ